MLKCFVMSFYIVLNENRLISNIVNSSHIRSVKIYDTSTTSNVQLCFSWTTDRHFLRQKIIHWPYACIRKRTVSCESHVAYDIKASKKNNARKRPHELMWYWDSYLSNFIHSKLPEFSRYVECVQYTIELEIVCRKLFKFSFHIQFISNTVTHGMHSGDF